MSEKTKYVAGREAEESPSLLDRSLQEHLGQKLRAVYNEVADSLRTWEIRHYRRSLDTSCSEWKRRSGRMWRESK